MKYKILIGTKTIYEAATKKTVENWIASLTPTQRKKGYFIVAENNKWWNQSTWK